jgi:hypothetical protein
MVRLQSSSIIYCEEDNTMRQNKGFFLLSHKVCRNNEEQNKFIRFIMDLSDPYLADKSKNLHYVVISLFYHKGNQDNYIQNMS